MCDTAPSICSTDCLMNHAWCLCRRRDCLRIESEIPEQQRGICGLEVLLPEQLPRHLPGKRGYRGMVAPRLVESGNKVCAPRAGRTAADSQFASKLGLPGRGKCSALFVAYPHPFNLRSSNSIGNRI